MVRILVKSWGIKVFGAQSLSNHLAGSMFRDRILQTRSPRGIALENRIGHSLRCRLRLGDFRVSYANCALGCRHEQYQGQASLTQSLAPPIDKGSSDPPNSQQQTVVQAAYSEPAHSAPTLPEPPLLQQPTTTAGTVGSTPTGTAGSTRLQQPEQIAAPQLDLPPVGNAPNATPSSSQVLTVPAAISMAFQLQPKLKASLESIRQARRNQDIAYAAFLPALRGGYSVGGFGLGVNGAGIPLPTPFTFIPGVGSVPVNFNVQSGYDLAELNLQWLIYDFGRRSSLYRTSGLAVDIAQLQTDRAYQTVADEVQNAYYQLLRIKSLHRIAEDALPAPRTTWAWPNNWPRAESLRKRAVLRASVRSRPSPARLRRF